jgi:hypothetical protein
LFEVNVASDPQNSWFGPIGALLVLPLSVVFAFLGLARRVPRVLGILALALPLYLVATAFGYRYTSVGRFFITAVVLTLPLAAVLYQRRLLALLITAIAGMTLLFALGYNREKPTGLSGETPMWRLDRVEAQTLVFGSDVRALLRALDETLPADEDLGVSERDVHFLYALYGSSLRRRVSWLPSADIPDEADRRDLRAVYLRTSSSRSRVRPDWTTREFGDAGTLLIRSARG